MLSVRSINMPVFQFLFDHRLYCWRRPWYYMSFVNMPLASWKLHASGTGRIAAKHEILSTHLRLSLPRTWLLSHLAEVVNLKLGLEIVECKSTINQRDLDRSIFVDLLRGDQLGLVPAGFLSSAFSSRGLSVGARYDNDQHTPERPEQKALLAALIAALRS